MEHDEKDLLDRVSRVRWKARGAMPFFGHLLMRMEPVVDATCKSAYVTPGFKMGIGPEFAASLTDAELATVLLHETLHAAFLYWSRSKHMTAIVRTKDGGRIPLSNIAHDYVVNLLIEDGTKGCRAVFEPPSTFAPTIPGSPEPFRLLIDPKYRDMSFEEVYDALLEEPPEGDGDGDGEGEGDGDGQGQDEGSGPGEGGRKAPKGARKHHADAKGNGNEEGEGEGGNSGAKEAQDWKMVLREARHVHNEEASRKAQGNLPGSLQRALKGLLEPRVPWTEILARWVGENAGQEDWTFRRPSRRSSAVGSYLPSRYKTGWPDVIVLWDTSGSMNGREEQIFAEVFSLCEDLQLSIRVMLCDTRITFDEVVEDPEDIQWSGGGGSDFCPAFARLVDEGVEGSVVLAFTDGMINVPAEKPVDLQGVLWVLWDTKLDSPPASWGDAVRITEDGYIEE